MNLHVPDNDPGTEYFNRVVPQFLGALWAWFFWPSPVALIWFGWALAGAGQSWGVVWQCCVVAWLVGHFAFSRDKIGATLAWVTDALKGLAGMCIFVGGALGVILRERAGAAADAIRARRLKSQAVTSKPGAFVTETGKSPARLQMLAGQTVSAPGTNKTNIPQLLALCACFGAALFLAGLWFGGSSEREAAANRENRVHQAETERDDSLRNIAVHQHGERIRLQAESERAQEIILDAAPENEVPLDAELVAAWRTQLDRLCLYPHADGSLPASCG